MVTEPVPAALETVAWLYDVRPSRPTENRAATIRLTLELEPTAAAALLALHVGEKFAVVLTPVPPPPRKDHEADPRQMALVFESVEA